MSPWFAMAIVLLASVALVAIRGPFAHRAMKVAVRKSYRGRVEVALLTLAWIAFIMPLVGVASPALAFADYPLHPIPLAGVLAYALGL